MKKYFIALGFLSFLFFSCSKFDAETYMRDLSSYVNAASNQINHLYSILLDTTLTYDQVKAEYDKVGKQLEDNYKNFQNFKKQEDILYPVVKNYLDTIAYLYKTDLKSALDMRKNNVNDFDAQMQLADLTMNVGLSMGDIAMDLLDAVEKFQKQYKIEE